MSLRFSALITGAVLAVSSLAHASGAPKPPTIEGVARIEGIAAHCATLDPNSAAQYRQLLNTVLHNVSSAEIKSDQATSRYTFALGLVDAELAKVPPNTVLSACKATLAGK